MCLFYLHVWTPSPSLIFNIDFLWKKKKRGKNDNNFVRNSKRAALSLLRDRCDILIKRIWRRGISKTIWDLGNLKTYSHTQHHKHVRLQTKCVMRPKKDATAVPKEIPQGRGPKIIQLESPTKSKTQAKSLTKSQTFWGLSIFQLKHIAKPLGERLVIGTPLSCSCSTTSLLFSIFSRHHCSASAERYELRNIVLH